MDSPPLTMRVFLSSAGDVAEERGLAYDVMRELGASHLLRGQVRFDIEAWDDPDASTPMEPGETPQASVNAQVDTASITSRRAAPGQLDPRIEQTR